MVVIGYTIIFALILLLFILAVDYLLVKRSNKSILRSMDRIIKRKDGQTAIAAILILIVTTWASLWNQDTV